MNGNFPACDAFTAREEGGLSMDRRDPGNWTGGVVGVGELRGTNYGIAAAAHPNVDIAALTPAAASVIRRSEYWAPTACDALPAGPDLVNYDFSINAGPGRAIRSMQTVLGVTVDGLVGRETTDAILSFSPTVLIEKLADSHAAFYRSTADFALYGAEWLARLGRCETAAKAMTAGQVIQPPRAAPPRPVLPVAA